jgi:hypothetical protein
LDDIDLKIQCKTDTPEMLKMMMMMISQWFMMKNSMALTAGLPAWHSTHSIGCVQLFAAA